MQLFGFATEAERDLFLMLIGVQSVGPKVALAVLSRRLARASCSNAIAAGRLGALPGRARDRQAHRRADHRGAAREGGRAGERRDRGHARVRRPAHDRARGPGRPRLHAAGGRLACSTSADGDTPEELIAERAEGRRGERGIRTPGWSASRTPRRSAPRTSSTARCGPRRLEDFVGQDAREGAARGVHRGGPRPRRGARPRAAGGAARASARPRSRRSWPTSSRPFVSTAGPALERKGDVASYLSSLEPRSRVLRGRDPPAAARARGDLLPGHGGPPAADHRGPGRGRRGS